MRSTKRSRCKGIPGLYMVTAEYPDKGHLDIALAAVQGGASIVQYRDKNASSRTLLETAMELRRRTKEAGISLIINDRVDVALAVEADGVHLGQDDMPLEVARRIMGESAIIGISATNLEEAIVADQNGADYIGLGPIFPTPSKDDAAPPLGLAGLREVYNAVDAPIVAIGGISIDDIEEVVKAGADSIAVISAVTMATDMVTAVRRLSSDIKRAIEERDGTNFHS